MTYVPTITPSAGMQRAAHSPARARLVYYATPFDYAAQLDREADHALAEGHEALADRLAHLALDYRTRAVGGRA